MSRRAQGASAPSAFWPSHDGVLYRSVARVLGISDRELAETSPSDGSWRCDVETIQNYCRTGQAHTSREMAIRLWSKLFVRVQLSFGLVTEQHAASALESGTAAMMGELLNAAATHWDGAVRAVAQRGVAPPGREHVLRLWAIHIALYRASCWRAYGYPGSNGQSRRLPEALREWLARVPGKGDACLKLARAFAYPDRPPGRHYTPPAPDGAARARARRWLQGRLGNGERAVIRSLPRRLGLAEAGAAYQLCVAYSWTLLDKWLHRELKEDAATFAAEVDVLTTHVAAAMADRQLDPEEELAVVVYGRFHPDGRKIVERVRDSCPDHKWWLTLDAYVKGPEAWAQYLADPPDAIRQCAKVALDGLGAVDGEPTPAIWQQMVALLEPAVEQRRPPSDMLETLCRAHWHLHEEHKALAVADRLIALHPTHEAGWLLLSALQLGPDPEASRATLLRAMDAVPSPSPALCAAAAHARATRGQLQEAIALLYPHRETLDADDLHALADWHERLAQSDPARRRSLQQSAEMIRDLASRRTPLTSPSRAV